MIRGVTVDWWHTIVEPPGGMWEEEAKRMRCEAILAALAKHGIACTYPRIDIAYDLWTDHLKRAWSRNVDWPAKVQVLDLLASAGYDGNADPGLVDDLREPIGSPLVTYPPEIHAGAAETLTRLKESGLKVALISNTGRTWGQFLRTVQDKLGLSRLFDHRTFSDEARVRKPDPRIFAQTLDALGLPPDQVAHVGDDVDADVAGAKEFGMRAVWYDRGKWPGASGERADATIHDWRELLRVIEGW